MIKAVSRKSSPYRSPHSDSPPSVRKKAAVTANERSEISVVVNGRMLQIILNGTSQETNGAMSVLFIPEKRFDKFQSIREGVRSRFTRPYVKRNDAVRRWRLQVLVPRNHQMHVSTFLCKRADR